MKKYYCMVCDSECDSKSINCSGFNKSFYLNCKSCDFRYAVDCSGIHITFGDEKLYKSTQSYYSRSQPTEEVRSNLNKINKARIKNSLNILSKFEIKEKKLT